MKKILFIPAQFLPIPAVKGGAVEVLLTQLIEENEKYHMANFYIVSKNDEDAKTSKYKNTNIIYLSRDKLSKASFDIVRFFRKLIYNRLTKRIFKNKRYAFNELTYFGYRCDKIAKKIKPDIIVSESYDKIQQLWPLVKRFGNDNFYYHLHYTKEEKLEVRKVFPNTIAISNFVLDHWVKDKSVVGKNYVLYNGIDLLHFNKTIADEEIIELRNQFHLTNDDFVVLFVGRLRPHKGILQLLQGFNRISNEHINLLLVGDFLSESKEHRGDEHEFEAECLRLIDSNKNIIRTGNISYEKIPDIYKISDIQIIPSMWEEGAGLVAIEGMATGLPLIITNSGGMPEYTGKECAIIVDRDENLIDNLSKSMIELYNNKELCKKMSEAGKSRAKLFSKENYYKNYMDILLKEETPNG